MSGPVPLSELVAALRSELVPPIDARADAVLVVGAHAGAGASTVAAAIADAAGEVTLVDAGPHETSGLLGAAEQETGVVAPDWRSGRRRAVTVLRPRRSPRDVRDVLTLNLRESRRLVVDAGWPWRSVWGCRNELATMADEGQVVLVCRATVPGVQRAESALVELPESTVVALTGRRRLTPAVRASVGQLLMARIASGQTVLVPRDGRVEEHGVRAEALSRDLVQAGRALAELVWPETAPHCKPSHRKGFLR